MGLRNVQGDTAYTFSTTGASTVTSDPIANAGYAGNAILFINVSAVGGSPTLNCSLEESNDLSSWTAVTGTSTAQLTAAGNAQSNGVMTKKYVRMTATIAGTATPTITGRALLLVLPN